MVASDLNKDSSHETDVVHDMKRIPKYKTKWQTVKHGIYNPETKAFLGRTGRQWGIVGLFYLVFFAVLALMFAICMQGLLATIDKQQPKWILDRSLISSNPGLGFRPRADDERTSLIWYSADNSSQVDIWVNKIDEFLEVYSNRTKLVNGGINQQTCSYEQPFIKKNNVCEFNVSEENLGDCAPEKDNYGFNNSAPCVFIKLNKIFDWVPEFYNDSNELPEDMPDDLKDHIRNQTIPQLNTVWVSCEGEHGVDEPIGPIEYFPKIRGFPGYFYPYKNLPAYLSPLVAVKFHRPALNKVLNVHCFAWAKNIKHNRKDKLGMVHFEIRIDKSRD